MKSNILAPFRGILSFLSYLEEVLGGNSGKWLGSLPVTGQGALRPPDVILTSPSSSLQRSRFNQASQLRSGGKGIRSQPDWGVGRGHDPGWRT